MSGKVKERRCFCFTGRSRQLTPAARGRGWSCPGPPPRWPCGGPPGAAALCGRNGRRNGWIKKEGEEDEEEIESAANNTSDNWNSRRAQQRSLAGEGDGPGGCVSARCDCKGRIQEEEVHEEHHEEHRQDQQDRRQHYQQHQTADKCRGATLCTDRARRSNSRSPPRSWATR